MIEQCQRVRLATAKLRREIVNRRRLDFVSRKSPDHTATQLQQAGGQEGAIKKALRVFVVVGRAPIPDVIEMNRELGRVQGPPIAKILSRSNHFVPRLKRHARSPICCDGSAPNWRRAPSP